MTSNRPGVWRGLGACLCGILAATAATAADWPQFLGPRRDGVSPETGLVQSWTAKGPPRVWDFDVGEGYSAPAVKGDRLILFHRIGDREVVECLDSDTGKPRWKFAYATQYEDDFGKGNGPRATPLIAGNRVYALGADGWLHCLELETGKKVWARSIAQDYKVPRNFFGIGSSPVMEGELLLANVGGKGAGIVAFAGDSGREVWKATSDGASYASPVIATIDGQRQAIFFTREGIVLLDPSNGSTRFRMRWRARSEASVNATSPVVVNDLVFFSASYETGGILIRVRKEGVATVWQNDEALSSHYCNSVHHKGYLYGFDGRQEVGAYLRCVELATGKVMWTRKRFGCGAMVLADGNLIVLTERGDLVLVEATPTGYLEKARAHVMGNLPCRAHLALANGRLYGRDGAKLVCWDLRSRKGEQ
jgi:outer membrane protein assembly factor BamB